jgi:hypothetical protein
MPPTTNTSSTSTAATEKKTDAVEQTDDQKFLQCLILSPPFLVAWGAGYLPDKHMMYIFFLMVLPFFVEKLVETLGGKGALVHVRDGFSASLEGGRLKQLHDVLRIPFSVLCGPFFVLFTFRQDTTSDWQFAGLCIAVYMSLVLCQAIQRRFIKPTEPTKELSKQQAKHQSKEEKKRVRKVE